ncbi:MAG: ORF6C domain-containing protein [Bacteroidales bacterium]|nr:ORF6C domain-containing protein [Bacteroidales bacterium]
MVKSLQKAFNYQEQQVRTIVKDGEPWFVAKDVCEIFGDTNYRRSTGKLDSDEKGVSQINTPGGNQEMMVINEPGLYSLLFNMQPQKGNQPQDAIEERLTALKAFKRWITHEVIPSIRKTGMYQADALTPDVAAIKIAKSLLVAVEAQSDRIDTVENRIVTLETTVEKEILVNSRQAAIIRFAVATRIRQLLGDDYKARSKQYFSWLYREIYARFAVPSYRDIPRKELNAVLVLIKGWQPVQEAREAS